MAGRTQIVKTVLNSSGDVQAGLNVNVYNIGTAVEATVYAARTGTGTLSQPLTTDSNGGVPGWLEEGAYEISVEGGTPEELHSVSGDQSNGTLWSHASRHNNGGADPITALDAAVITTGQFSGARILDDAITESKIQDAAVTQNKIADESVTPAKHSLGVSHQSNGQISTSSATYIDTGCSVAIACPAGYVVRVHYMIEGLGNDNSGFDLGYVRLYVSDGSTLFESSTGRNVWEMFSTYKPSGIPGEQNTTQSVAHYAPSSTASLTYKWQYKFTDNGGPGTLHYVRNARIYLMLERF
jgi:hypothetical protein